MSKTVLRRRTGSVPEGIEPQLREWIVTQNADNQRDNQDIEDEFNKIGLVKRWTPVLTYATPGNLSVGYAVQMGDLVRTKDGITASFFIQTNAYSFTTASGALEITGLPYTASTLSDDSGMTWVGSMNFNGITKANYTQFVPTIAAGSNIVKVIASGSGQTEAFLAAADVPTGGTVILNGTLFFRIRP